MKDGELQPCPSFNVGKTMPRHRYRGHLWIQCPGTGHECEHRLAHHLPLTTKRCSQRPPPTKRNAQKIISSSSACNVLHIDIQKEIQAEATRPRENRTSSSLKVSRRRSNYSCPLQQEAPQVGPDTTDARNNEPKNLFLQMVAPWSGPQLCTIHEALANSNTRKNARFSVGGEGDHACAGASWAHPKHDKRNQYRCQIADRLNSNRDRTSEMKQT